MSYQRIEETPTRLEIIQKDVEETKGIMHDTIVKVGERYGKLGHLEAQSDALANDSKLFKKETKALSRKMWWRNAKMWVIAAVVVLLLLSVLGIIIWQVTKK